MEKHVFHLRHDWVCGGGSLVLLQLTLKCCIPQLSCPTYKASRERARAFECCAMQA